MPTRLIQYLANRRIPDVVTLDDKGRPVLDAAGNAEKRTVEFGELVPEANFWPNTERYLKMNWLVIAGMEQSADGPRPGPGAKAARFDGTAPRSTAKKRTRKKTTRKKVSRRAPPIVASPDPAPEASP